MPAKDGRPLSAAVKAGDYVFLSGRVGNKDGEGKEVKGIKAQTKQCFENIQQVLKATSSSLDDVVKVSVFLTEADFFDEMNEVMRSYFPRNFPARTTLITKLAKPEMLVEVECIAYCPSNNK
jgi:2-iminobutanoate/2-iminopropanoate deaminase